MLHSIITNALIVKDDKILISQRALNEKHDPLKWTIPGGKVEKTEGNVFNILEKTLKREVKEEVGLTIKDDIKLISQYFYKNGWATRYSVNFYLLLEKWNCKTQRRY